MELYGVENFEFCVELDKSDHDNILISEEFYLQTLKPMVS